jgi:preprotein translocase subunit SecG
MLLLITWTAVASAFRYFLPPSTVGRETVTMLTVFVVLALVMTVALSRKSSGTATRSMAV